MGGKKRSSESVEAEEGVTVDTRGSEVVLSDKEPKKKMKKEKGKKEKPEESEATSSVLPMERMKKRKKMDKNRRFKASKKDESTKVKKIEVEEPKLDAPESSRNSFPEFHIGVFKDLGSSDSALREAAAEALVSELQEVQKAYDGLEDKSSVESGLNLEAQKDDGLNDCAPSLRYAVRRLIRGVSSSREV